MAGWLACASASASGLQVSPTLLTLQASQTADGLWLSNTGDSELRAQVRVFHWTQQDGHDELVPSRDLVASPPMLAIAPGQKQLVRIIRTGAVQPGGEAAYRVILDELPVQQASGRGLQFVLRYSVPVFIEPAGAGAVSAHLDWSLQRDGDKAVLQIHNGGTGRAQIVDLTFTDSGQHRTGLGDGLFGYVLPGATMRWTLHAPATAFTRGGRFEATINGEKATQNLSLADRPR